MFSVQLTFVRYDIFQHTIPTGSLPDKWKSGQITPIFKKGDKQRAKNYRPVSLTSIPRKILEQLIREGILNHLMTNNLLTKCQHGFIRGRSCVTQLLAVLDIWTEIMARRGNIDCIYLDFSKAFDSVPHRRMLHKLQAYGIKGNVLRWIDHLLQGRVQRVSVNGVLYMIAAVISGIPQGSVLGPILFIIFVNDMPEIVNTMIQMFADDTKLFWEIKDAHDRDQLQNDLKALEDWSNEWLLKFNADKCKVMHLGKSQGEFKYTMTKDDHPIELEKTTLKKDLGVHVDPSLTFSAHCEQQVNKANRLLGLIRRSYTYIDGDSLVKLFTALVRPHLEYANAVWYPVYKKDSTLLENVQRRATKLVPGLRDEPYETRLQRLKLPSLQYRRVCGDMIELFKHITGIYRVDADYIKLDNSITRGHDKRLKKQRASKIVRQNFLTFRATNTWNSLPQEVVAAPTLNAFKARLDKHWTKFRFSLQSLHELNKADGKFLAGPNLPTGFEMPNHRRRGYVYVCICINMIIFSHNSFGYTMYILIVVIPLNVNKAIRDGKYLAPPHASAWQRSPH